jgi:uncharacterized protein
MKTLLISILLAAPLFALAYTSPGAPTGLVNDFAHVLAADQVASLESALQANKQSTGSEIAVVTIKSLDGDTIENYAVKLFEEWGIGQKGKDNGALLLIAIEDRKVRIEVGYGLEPVLTDALTSSIIRNTLAPAFKEGKYYEGISSAVHEMAAVVAGDASGVPTDTPESSAPWWGNFRLDGFVLWIVFLAFQWFMSVMARSRSWWLGGAVGGVIGVIVLLIAGLTIGLITGAILIPLGLLLDYFVSREYGASAAAGRKPHWWAGGPWIGGGFGGGGGGFGGFGGGRSGGGGASGGW